MSTAVSTQAHWHLNHPLPSVHYVSIKEKSTTSPIIEHSVSFPLNCVIPDVYLKDNPILRGNCECGPTLKPFSWVGVIVVTRPSRALSGCILFHVTISSLCWLTAVNGRDREVVTGNFIGSVARGEPRHVHLCQGNPELAWQITDTWALKEMRMRASLGHHNPFGKVFHLSQTVVTGLG